MVTFLRIFILSFVLMLAGCSGGLTEMQQLNLETSQQPSGSWFHTHGASRHMRCFPAYCH